MRDILVYRDENGGWVAECPGLPGCISYGSSEDEVLDGIEEAILWYIEALEIAKIPIPIEHYRTRTGEDLIQ